MDLMYSRADGYALKKIENEYYILSFGCAQAAGKSGFRINETGAFIWELLKMPCSRERIIDKTEEYLREPGETRFDASGIVDRFLNSLVAAGVAVRLADEPESVIETMAANVDGETLDAGQRKIHRTTGENYAGKYKIGGIVLSLNCGMEYVPAEFIKFQTVEEARTDAEVCLVICVHPAVPSECNARICGEDVDIFACNDGFRLAGKEYKYCTGAFVPSDGSYIELYGLLNDPKEFAKEAFFMLKLCFLYVAQLKGKFALHSASVLYRDRAWIFSAHSGVGKSTHVALWKEYADAEIINGDMNLVGFENGKAYVYGTPWCGTSGTASEKTYRLGGIIMLERASEPSIQTLEGADRVLKMIFRGFSPLWTEGQLDVSLKVLNDIADKVYMCKLKCNTQKESCLAMKQEIDEFLDIR